jgi:hypothetical protein
MLARTIVAGGLLLACAAGAPSGAADISVHHRAGRVVPEHHIIEVAIHPPGSRQFIINGSLFTARSPACLGWEAGNRIDLVEGDWHGWCQTAVFYNRTLRRSCEMSCGYF